MDELKQKLQEKVKDLGVLIKKVSWRSENKQNILQVEIKHQTESVDLNLCALVSQTIDGTIEELVTKSDYILEVCSAGIEEELESCEEVNNHIGDYVLVRFKKPINNVIEIKGNLETLDEKYYVEAFIKGVKKKFSFTYDDIDNIRLSVKI